MWQSHRIAVLSTYWTNCYHSFFFMTFRTKMIHGMFPEYFSVKIGGTGQPLNYNCLCHTCSPHPTVSAIGYEVVYPLIQKSQFQMAGEYQQDGGSSLFWGIPGKGAKLGKMCWERVEVRRAMWEMQKILFPRSFGICLLGRKNTGGRWCRYCK